MSLTSSPRHKEIWLIAFPMLLTGISTPLLGMVDTAVVGHLSEPYYLGAVAIAAMIFNLLFWAMGFLRMSTTGLTAQSQGTEEESYILLRGLSIAMLVGLLLIIFQSPISQLIFSFVDSSEEVIQHATSYFDIRIWAAPATLCTYVLLGWFLGKEKPLINLLIVLCINISNIILDIIFVVILETNSAGVAWATLIAEYLGLIVGVVILKRYILLGEINLGAVFKLEPFQSYLSINVNIFFRTLFLIACFSFFTLQGAKFGPVILAANAVLMNFQTLMAYALDSLAHAAEVLVGKTIFSQDKKKLKSTLKTTAIWSFGIAIIFSGFYLLFGEPLIHLLTGIIEVQEMAVLFLPWIILSPLLSVWSFWLDGVFIGAGYSVAMRNTMFISMLAFFVSWYLLLPWENNGLWAALMIFMFARGVSMMISAYRKNLFT